jgi:tetratricopeptide (TPR) repeat protein
MKKNLILTLVFIITLVGFADAQKKKKKDTDTPKDSVAVQTTPAVQAPSTPPVVSKAATISDERKEILAKMYALGFRYYDLQVSQMALYEMIASDLNNVALRDSLALLYYNMGKYGSAIAVASDVLSVEKNNLAMLEVRALSNENIQYLDQALADYEKLYLLSPNPFSLYKMAGLQLTLKKYEQCKTNLDILMNDANADSVTVPVSVNQVQQQEVPLKAAALNLKGLLNKAQGNKAVAQQSFSEALKIEPNFQAAKANLADLNKPAGATKPAPKK